MKPRTELDSKRESERKQRVADFILKAKKLKAKRKGKQ